MTDFNLPMKFGNYYLLELINVGGMAEVYKAKTFGVEGFEKIVAIKKILPEVAEDEEFIKMFIDEAKISVQLQHPNVVQILQLGKFKDSYFIAMELVNGKDLKTIRRRLKRVDLLMPVEQTAFLISQVCDGLDYAHRKVDEQGNPLNIIHRDISPQNIIVSYEGTVKLIDFGVAKAKSKSTKTQAGMLKGKFSYMSPEQVAGKPIDRRSDVFSLGIVLFEMLTGKRLFLGKNDVETLEKIRKAEVPPPSVFNSSVPPELDKIVLKALTKDREERYQWADEFGEDLKRFNFQSPKKFTRQDMMNFMKEFFSDEIEEDMAKLEEYKKLTVPKSFDQDGSFHNVEDDDLDIEIEKSSKSKYFVILFLLLTLGIGGFFGYNYFFAKNSNEAVLLVDSNVKGAIIDLDENTMNHKRCNTPCKFDKLLQGIHNLKIRKFGYITKQQTVSLIAGEPTSKLIKLSKIGELKTYITIKSSPSGAKIFINDKQTKEVTPAVVKIPVGVDLTIRVEEKGFFPSERILGKVKEDSNKEISLILKPRSRAAKNKVRKMKKRSSVVKKSVVIYKREDAAFLSISTHPWTNIYIDGVFVKTTPLINYPIPPGKHKIRFKNDKSGIDKIIPVNLEPKKHSRIIKDF
jgi:serine/threonine protein kinase